MARKAPVPVHTQAPNIFYDEWLKEINSLAELKVIEVVIRNTFGWHKDRVAMSLADIVEATGLSKSSTQDGVRRAIKDGYVSRVSNGRSFAYEIPLDVPESGTCQNDAIPEVGTRTYRDSVRSADLSLDRLKKGNKQPKPSRAERYMLPPDSMLELSAEDFAWLRQKAPLVGNYERATEKWYRKQVTTGGKSKTIHEWRASWELYMMNYSDGESGRSGNGATNERPGWMAAEK